MRTSTEQTKKGFTLIELLVVIAIIGILAAVTLSSLNKARAKARDTIRLQAVKQIETALEMYYLDNDSYPKVSDYGESSAGGWDTSAEDIDGDGNYLLDPLVDGGYIAMEQLNSLATNDTHPSPFLGLRYYLYNSNHAIAHSCDRIGNFYVIQVNLELPDTGTSHSTSPGFSCSGRNWGTEAHYVVGKFE